MINILLAYENQHLLDYYESVCSDFDNAKITKCSDLDSALEYLSFDSSINLIFVDYESGGSNKFLRTLFALEKAIPTVLTCLEKNYAQAKKAYKTKSLLEYFCHGGTLDLMLENASKMVNVNLRSSAPSSYCKIHLPFFYSFQDVSCDVYIKINDDKYLKVFNRYESIKTSELERFEDKQIQHLYIRSRDLKLISQKLLQALEKQEQSLLPVSLKSSSLLPIGLQEVVSESIKTLGLTPESIELTNRAITATLELLKKSPSVMQVMQQVFTGHAYISEHSFFVSYLACSIVEKLNHYPKESSLILTIASFFHDISITEDHLAAIQDLQTQEFRDLGIEEQEVVKNHIGKSLELIRQIDGIPKLSSTVIHQHHEKYDGTGFPNGLNYKRIHFTSVVFNIAHELSSFIYETAPSMEALQNFTIDLSTQYTKGDYPTVIQALFDIFHIDIQKFKKVS